MNEPSPVELTEDRIPMAGILEAIDGMVDLYGGTMGTKRDASCDFTLPLRRGVPASGSIECTISWVPDDEETGTVTLRCSRDVDAPKAQRVLLLVAGVIGAVMFMLWPFFPGESRYGTLAWLGGAVAIAVYLLTLRRSSGGLAYDFLQRLAAHQRSAAEFPRP